MSRNELQSEQESPAQRELPVGASVGHWSDLDGRTGCTVVLVPQGAVGGVAVRGASPATLCTDALQPSNPGTFIDSVHGVVLTGGSAFGLAATSGVMRYFEELGVGLAFGPVSVPIVSAAAIFDLLVGDPRARPDGAAGYAACKSATAAPAVGAIGAGTGATVAKGGATHQTRPGGVGVASARADGAVVAAVMVANSIGGIWDDERHEWIAPLTAWDRTSSLMPGANTTIGVVVTDAKLTKDQASRVAMVAHDGIARAVRPAHTRYDGDTMFWLATGHKAVPYDVVEVVAAEVVARAIAIGVRATQRHDA